MGIGRIDILLQDGVVQLAHQLARLDGDFHLLLNIGIGHIYQKLQPVVFLFQVSQVDFLRLAIGLFHIIHQEGGKVAGHNPARMLGQGQLRYIPFGLLKRRQQGTIRLPDRRTEVLVQALLLNQHTGGGDAAVNETCMIKAHLIFKEDELFRLRYTENTTQQRKPEFLALSLLVTFALPILGKFGGCGSLLYVSHGQYLPLGLKRYIHCSPFYGAFQCCGFL